MNVNTILFATDFSETAQKAMQTAVELARHFDAQLVILHAYNVEIPIASPMMSGGGTYSPPDSSSRSTPRHASRSRRSPTRFVNRA